MTGRWHPTTPDPGSGVPGPASGAAGNLPDESVVADLALDAALDLAPAGGTTGDDGLLALAASVRGTAVRGTSVLPTTAPPPVAPGTVTVAAPSRSVRRRRSRPRRLGTAATLAASAAVMALGAELALQPGIGPAVPGAWTSARLAHHQGLVVMAPSGSPASAGSRVVTVSCPGRHDCLAIAGAPGRPVLMLSSDGGATWGRQPIPVPVTSLDAVFCASTEVCWVVGAGGGHAVALATGDGGRSWTSETLPGGIATLRSISCAGVEVCWAVGDGTSGTAAVVATTDGGTTWRAQQVPTGVTELGDVSCTTVRQCWAGGSATDGPAVVATADGGARWARVSLPAGGRAGGPVTVTSVTCSAPGTCWATETGGHGTVVLAHGQAGWHATARVGTRGSPSATGGSGAVYEATTGCGAGCAIPTGGAADHALAVIEGTGSPVSGTASPRSALDCPSTVQCWILEGSGSGFSAASLAPSSPLQA